MKHEQAATWCIVIAHFRCMSAWNSVLPATRRCREQFIWLSTVTCFSLLSDTSTHSVSKVCGSSLEACMVSICYFQFMSVLII